MYGFSARRLRATPYWLIDDSTAPKLSPPEPCCGRGQVIRNCFTPEAAVKNFARSGHNAKSLLEEGARNPVVPLSQPGDYVFIQFGHNDEKREADRHTDPYGSYQEFLSRYVDDTLKAGGIPVLVTPVGRGGLKKSSGAGSHGCYPAAMLELAKKKSVLAIDLSSLSEAHYRKLGGSDTLKLFVASIDGKDDTHFLPAGAQEIARLAARAIKGLGTPLAAQMVLP